MNTYESSEMGSSYSSEDEHETPSCSSNDISSDIIEHSGSPQILDSEIVEAVRQLANSCSCLGKCFEKEEDPNQCQWYRWIKDSRGLNKRERKCRAMLLLSTSLTAPKRHRISPVYQLPFVGTVCRNFFSTYWDLSKYQLAGLLKDMSDNRRVELRPHGRCGEINIKHHLSPEVEDHHILVFLSTLKQEEGEAIATCKNRTINKDGERITHMETFDTVLIPSHHTYNRLSKKYNQENPAFEVSRKTFRRVWLRSNEFKNVKIRKPAKDVCDFCGVLRNQFLGKKERTKKQQEETDYDIFQHKRQYRMCRAEYKKDREEAAEPNSIIKCHSFDFQQVVDIPSLAQQPASWFFFTPFKLYVFGIIDEGTDEHYHTMYTEAQQGKGANQVVSLLHTYLTAKDNAAPTFRNPHSREPSPIKLHLWADNCGGQNKNKTMIWYLAWAALQGWCAEIELRFQVKGHTRNSVDRGFGIAKFYISKMDFYYLSEYIKAVEDATEDQKIRPISFIDNTGSNTVFRDWDKLFSPFLKPVEKIQSYHFFRFEPACPWVVMVRSMPDEDWKFQKLLKFHTPADFAGSIDENKLTPIL